MRYCVLQPWSIRTKLKFLKSLSIISIVLGTLLNSVHPIHHRQPLLNSLALEGKKALHAEASSYAYVKGLQFIKCLLHTLLQADNKTPELALFCIVS